MKCLTCGTENADYMKFCTNCGAQLNHTAPDTPSQNQFNGQSQYNQQNQFGGQNQFNTQSQFNGQPQDPFYGQSQYNQQNQFGGQPQFNQQNQFNGQSQNQFGGQSQFYSQNQYQGQPGFGPQGQPFAMDKSQFFDLPNLKRCRSYITGSAVMMYISATLTFIVNVLITSNVWGIIDVLLLLGLGLGIHLGKSRVCSIISCVYASFNVLYMIIAEGTAGGTLILIASIMAIVYTFKYQGAWEKYKRTGVLPTV